MIAHDHVSVATAHANAQREAVRSHCPARVALACNAHATSEESPPIPESVATADRISPRLASDIVPLHDSVASPFFHHARFPFDTAHAPKMLKPEPSHHAFGARIQV